MDYIEFDEMPIYEGRTPKSEIKYKLFWFGILFLGGIGLIIGLIILIINQFYG